MSNKQTSASDLIDNWQKQMQEYLNDPRVADLMMDYYGKFQSNMQDATKKNTDDDDDGDPISQQLANRVDELEKKVEALERILGRFFK